MADPSPLYQTSRIGASFPIADMPLLQQGQLVRDLEDAGYTDLWSPETSRYDAFVPLAVAAAQSQSLRLGTAIANVVTRGPAVLAMSAAAMAEAAPGRFCLGLGVSSRVVAEDWNRVPFPDGQIDRMSAVVAFLRSVLNGEPPPQALLSPFRLSVRPPETTPIYVAALGPNMARLAGAVADGVLINWVSPEDVRVIRNWVTSGAAEAQRDPSEVEVVCILPTQMGSPGASARRLIARYSAVPHYAAAFSRLGFAAPMARVADLWIDGDREQSAAAIPEDVLKELIVGGSPDACAARLREFVDAGVDTPVLAIQVDDPSVERRAGARREALVEIGRSWHR